MRFLARQGIASNDTGIMGDGRGEGRSIDTHKQSGGIIETSETEKYLDPKKREEA